MGGGGNVNPKFHHKVIAWHNFVPQFEASTLFYRRFWHDKRCVTRQLGPYTAIEVFQNHCYIHQIEFNGFWRLSYGQIASHRDLIAQLFA